VDWEPTLRFLLEDLSRGTEPSIISARFHNTLAEAILQVALAVDESTVALTGGCFQNRLLLEGAVGKLRAAGFRPYWHQRVPANDGGVALGQAVAGSLAQ